MGITLTVIQAREREKTRARIDGPVAHLGRSLPKDKRGVRLRGRGIARHHGKIFYAYRSFRYINLTDRPTRVFRGAGFSFQLDPLMPQCEILPGDRLEIGEAMVHVRQLTPPRPTGAGGGGKVTEKLTCRYVDCARCAADRACRVDQATGGLLAGIRQYTCDHEILRACVDWLAELFSAPAGEDRGLKLSRPEAIAIRRRPGLPPRGPAGDVPVERGLSSRRARVAPLAQTALPAGRFDTGRGFVFSSPTGKCSGAAAGILEGIRSAESSPRAGHFLLLQYAPGQEPSRDVACVVHHAASCVSQSLAAIESARLRRQHELQRRAGRESAGLFHQMLGICSSARGSAGRARSLLPQKPRDAEAELARADGELALLLDYINRGRWSLAGESFGHDAADIPALCRRALDAELGGSEAMRQTRDFRVVVGSGAGSPLRRVPCDPFALEQALRHLLANSNRAVGKTAGRDKRIMILVDLVRRGGLPYARLRVADNGAGMSPEALSAVFEGRFSTESRRHGLGAQFVADGVRRHCGAIEVASAPGRGTVVGILVPAPGRTNRRKGDDASEWLGPYNRRATRKALVTRRDLESVLRADAELAACFAPGKGETQW